MLRWTHFLYWISFIYAYSVQNEPALLTRNHTMNYWVITAALYEENDQLQGVMLAKIEGGTEKIIEKATLTPVQKVIDIIRAGHTVLALWPTNSEERALVVGISHCPNDVEILRTLAKGKTKTRGLEQIWSVYDMTVHRSAQSDWTSC